MTKNKNPGRETSEKILPIIVLVLLLPFSSAQLEINEVQQIDLVEYGSSQQITAQINSNSSLIRYVLEYESNNYTLIRASDLYTYLWTPGTVGANSYSIYVENAEGEFTNYEGQFFVLDSTPPLITAYGPSGDLNQATVELWATTDENASCKYDSRNVNYGAMAYSLPGSGKEHFEQKTLADGTYSFYIRCMDESSNVCEPKKMSFKIDSTAPQINFNQPDSVVSQNPVYVRISTDEAADCKWALGQGTYLNYSSLPNSFQQTGSIIHEQSLTLTEGLNSIIVACKDSMGNYNNPLIRTIELNAPPKAEINLEKNEGYDRMRQGTYLVKLTSSEALSAQPSLSLTYQGITKSVPLQGSGSNWQGYLIISEENINSVGEFKFSASDGRGGVGTEIGSGKLIQIDTRQPRPPSNLKLVMEDEKIRVSWDSSLDEVSHYNIYRSTSGNTDQSNFKYSSKNNFLLDSDIQNKIGYFYKVSAVSKSGVESYLSTEVFIMTQLTNMSGFRQDTLLLSKIESKILELESLVSRIEKTSSEINGDVQLNEVASQNKLFENMDVAKSQLQLMIGELKTYRESKISALDLSQRIDFIDSKILAIKKKVVVEISIVDSRVSERDLSDDSFKSYVGDFLANTQLTESQKEAYLVQAKKINDASRITRTINHFKIRYDSGVEDSGFIISEKIMISENLLGSVLLQEVIPRQSVSLSEVEFNVKPHDVGKQGPLWKIKELPDNELVYSQKKDLAYSDLERIDSVLLVDINSFLDDLSRMQANGSQIDAAVISSVEGGSVLSGLFDDPLNLFIMLGVVLAGLMGYYVFVLDSKKKSSKFAGSEKGIRERYLLVSQEIQRAKQLLGSGDVNAAANAYLNAKEIYSGSKFGFFKSVKINFELNLLYEEILLKRK